jgi:uncharacterized protein (TIGR00296 family)
LSFDLTQKEGETLVRFARKAVEEYLKTRKTISVPAEIPRNLLQLCGVFVTINSVKKREKELRGCIGYPYPTMPLAKAVIDSAINAATQDPRFEPLSLAELSNVVFEVSVLTPPEVVDAKRATEYPSKIKVGKDGLIVERGMFKGLLLPQVPVEWEWNEEEFLCQCSIKAGLPPDCWLMSGTRICKFQAMIFGEKTPKGEIEGKPVGGK